MSVPHNKSSTDRFTVKFQKLTQLLDLPSFTSFSAEETTRLVLGNLPAQVLQKEVRIWIQESTPLCGEYAYGLCTHITSLIPAVVDMSSHDEDAASSDNHDDFSLTPPPPWLPTCIHTTNHHHARISRPRRSTAHRASHPLQMAHV